MPLLRMESTIEPTLRLLKSALVVAMEVTVFDDQPKQLSVS